MGVDKIALRLIVGGDASGAKKALKELGTESKKTGDELGKGLKVAQGAAAVGLTAIAGLAAGGVKSYEDLTASIANLQRQSKISSEDASLLVGQWQRYGVSIEAGSRATKMLSMAQFAVANGAKGSERAAKAFSMIGMSLDDLKTKSPAQILEQVRESLAKMPPSAARTYVASTLMGRGFQSMSKWISASSSDLDALNQMLRDTGQVMNEKELAQAKEDLKQQALLQVQWRGIMVQIGRSVMPYVQGMVSMLSRLLTVLQPLAPELKYVAAALAGFLIVSKISQGINAMSTALSTLRGAASAARSAIAGRWGASAAPATIGQGMAAPAGGSGATGANTAAEQRNTQATNLNTAAAERATAATNREAVASGRAATADSKSVVASDLETAADRKSAAASSLAGTKVGGLGSKAARAESTVAGMGGAAAKTEGNLFGMNKATAKSAATMAGFAIAIAFTMNQLSKLGNAIDQMNQAAAQAGQAKNEALANAKKDLAYIAGKYGKDSPQYQKELALYNAILKQINADQYNKPWWAKAGSSVKGGVSHAWNWAFGGAQASGGSYLVNRPTLFVAGEAGTEQATFTPIGRGGGVGSAGNVVHLHVHVHAEGANFIGTDRQAAKKLADMVAPDVRAQILAVAGGGF